MVIKKKFYWQSTKDCVHCTAHSKLTFSVCIQKECVFFLKKENIIHFKFEYDPTLETVQIIKLFVIVFFSSFVVVVGNGIWHVVVFIDFSNFQNSSTDCLQ